MKKNTRILVFVFAVILFLLERTNGSSSVETKWSSWGGLDANNTRRYNLPSDMRGISFRLNWAVDLGGDVSSTPTLDPSGNIYATDFGGHVNSIYPNGTIRWRVLISEYTGNNKSLSRSSVAIAKSVDGKRNVGVFGDNRGGAYVMAIDLDTTQLLWKTLLNNHPYAIITQSATIYEDIVYVGVSSREEAAAVDPNYPCCSFRGNFVALNLTTGFVLWNFDTIPSYLTGVGLYSGAAVWGSAPSLSVDKNNVCFATGNPYDVPKNVSECEETRKDGEPSCIDPRVLFNSIICLVRATGSLSWVVSVDKWDAWNVACGFGSVGVDTPTDSNNCPQNPGEDVDFGQAPIAYGSYIAIAQKSGVLWVKHANNGSSVCQVQVGPSGVLGGSMWGSSIIDSLQGDDSNAGDTNSKRYPNGLPPNGRPILYVSITNVAKTLFELVDGTKIEYGFISAIDGLDCTIYWQTPDPAHYMLMGPISTSGNYVFAGSMATEGPMYVVDGRTGRILSTFISGGSVNSGPSFDRIQDANRNEKLTLYWGNGYSNILGTPGGYLFSLGIN